MGKSPSADSPTNTFDRAYEYDQIGNRKKSADGLIVTTGTTATTYDANSLNQYSQISVPSVQSVVPIHDQDGNATSYPLPVDPTTNASLVYDGENRLISVTTGATTVSYTYDSQSRRVARTEGANTTVYLYDGWNCLAEYALHNSSFNLHTSLSWGLDISGSLQGAGGVGGLLAVTKHQEQNTGHFYTTYDGNGNVSEYIDVGGVIAAHYEYDPFGRVIVATGSQAADFAYRFSTKPVDPATGLYYYGYRWYDPDTGRWINRDPIEEGGGVNLYGYVGNDPEKSFDVLGLSENQGGGAKKPKKIIAILTGINNRIADVGTHLPNLQQDISELFMKALGFIPREAALASNPAFMLGKQSEQNWLNNVENIAREEYSKETHKECCSDINFVTVGWSTAEDLKNRIAQARRNPTVVEIVVMAHGKEIEQRISASPSPNAATWEKTGTAGIWAAIGKRKTSEALLVTYL